MLFTSFLFMFLFTNFFISLAIMFLFTNLLSTLNLHFYIRLFSFLFISLAIMYLDMNYVDLKKQWNIWFSAYLFCAHLSYINLKSMITIMIM
jgi:hypothetical protein